MSLAPAWTADLCLPYIGVVGSCWRCGTDLPKYRRQWCSDPCRDEWYRNHLWGVARAVARKRDGDRCVRCGGHMEEVDHIVPRRGQPIHHASCLHHQDNLRSLCHDCHSSRRSWETP